MHVQNGSDQEIALTHSEYKEYLGSQSDQLTRDDEVVRAAEEDQKEKAPGHRQNHNRVFKQKECKYRRESAAQYSAGQPVSDSQDALAIKGACQSKKVTPTSEQLCWPTESSA